MKLSNYIQMRSYLYAANYKVSTNFQMELVFLTFLIEQFEFSWWRKIVNYEESIIRSGYNDVIEEIFFNDWSFEKVGKNIIITI